MPDVEADKDSPEPKRDFAKMFDLDRTTLTKSMVDRMETCMWDIETAQDDLKAVQAEAKEREFGPHDIAAMKKIAKLRLKDKGADAKEQLEALERIAKAVGFNLFDWASYN